MASAWYEVQFEEQDAHWSTEFMVREHRMANFVRWRCLGGPDTYHCYGSESDCETLVEKARPHSIVAERTPFQNEEYPPRNRRDYWESAWAAESV